MYMYMDNRNQLKLRLSQHAACKAASSAWFDGMLWKKMPVQGGDFPNICLGLLPYFLGVPQVLAERGFGAQVLDGWSRMVEHLMSMVSGGLGYVMAGQPTLAERTLLRIRF